MTYLKYIILTILLVPIFVIITGCTPDITTLDTNQNVNLAEDTNNSIQTNTPDLQNNGKVFIKSYGSNSESWGITTDDGAEIGMNEYDSMAEQLREHFGQEIEVIFKKICMSTQKDCCRSAFFYCGEVESWKLVE